ncbi:hypothetical protein VE04_08348 [Pseudogymnoascus sp. 24MN13]|nr:hypothetical protein VE04_08348 [Pseudogymnoascus sp. 24MN13]
MAHRILITCKSHKVPGPDNEKATLLANQACQKVWGRDFNEALGDRITLEGEFTYGVRCNLLVDNGPVDSEDYTTSFFRWSGEALVLTQLPASILKTLEERFQFNPADRPQRIRYTDEEYKKTFGSKKYDELVRGKAERREIARRFDPEKLQNQRQPQAN